MNKKQSQTNPISTWNSNSKAPPLRGPPKPKIVCKYNKLTSDMKIAPISISPRWRETNYANITNPSPYQPFLNRPFIWFTIVVVSQQMFSSFNIMHSVKRRSYANLMQRDSFVLKPLRSTVDDSVKRYSKWPGPNRTGPNCKIYHSFYVFLLIQY